MWMKGDKGAIAIYVLRLGYVVHHEGDDLRAGSKFRRSLTMFRRPENRLGMVESMAGPAGLKACQGQVEWGVVMLCAAEAVLKVTIGTWLPADRVEVEANKPRKVGVNPNASIRLRC